MSSFIHNTQYDILTPDGFRNFDGLHSIIRHTRRVFADGMLVLEGSPNHRILTTTGYKILQELILGDQLISRTGTITVTNIENGPEYALYDPINVAHPEQAFYTGEVISHNCDFMGSANTLVASWKLAQMTYTTPIEVRGPLSIYKKPIYTSDAGPAHVYLIIVDVGQGQEQDFSVCQVIDISQKPFEQVAIWRDNKVKPAQFAKVVSSLGRMYANAFLFFEINAEGAAVADMVQTDFEYENMIWIFPHPKKGQQISSGHHARARVGLKVSEATKRIGCAGLKSLVENEQLFIKDYETLRELTTFVAKMAKNGSHAKTYEAEVGNHDDTIMPLVLLGWLSLQSGFENYVGLSMRQLLSEGHGTLTFDAPFIGVLGDLNRPVTLERSPSGFEVVDDADFWNEDSKKDDDNWLL